MIFSDNVESAVYRKTYWSPFMTNDITKKTKVLEGCRPDQIPDYVYTSTEPIILKGLVKDWPLTIAAQESAAAATQLLKSHYNGKPAPVYFL